MFQRCVEMDLMLFSALNETAAIVFPLLSIEIMLKFLLSQKEEEGEKILKMMTQHAISGQWEFYHKYTKSSTHLLHVL